MGCLESGFPGASGPVIHNGHGSVKRHQRAWPSDTRGPSKRAALRSGQIARHVVPDVLQGSKDELAYPASSSESKLQSLHGPPSWLHPIKVTWGQATGLGPGLAVSPHSVPRRLMDSSLTGYPFPIFHVPSYHITQRRVVWMLCSEHSFQL
ncbi:hypothetical protein EYF80_001635 [Liparis tanakae]|uniref:Uncharacterized protein n=1 Tax=Liparis tanakae TaxID=230148 RepID=A0A4Z2JDY5_9TELE|nr:hypothetical protein EYF80_001635 [Liparis tanakae]